MFRVISFCGVAAALLHHPSPPRLLPALPQRVAPPRCAAGGPGPSPEEEEGGALFGGLIAKGDNPYVTSKADRMRAEFGERSVTGTTGRAGNSAVEEQLGADLAAFKVDRGFALDTPLAGGAARELEEAQGEVGLLQKVINTLGTVLTYNFFIIIGFFTWFVAGVVGQFGFENTEIIGTFRAYWDVLILPLLTTHMTLTFLSAGLERLSKASD